MEKSKWAVSKVTKQLWEYLRIRAIDRGNKVHNELEEQLQTIVNFNYKYGNTSARAVMLDFSEYNGELNIKYINSKQMQNLQEGFKYAIGVKLITFMAMDKGDAFLCGHYRRNVERLPESEKKEDGYVVDYGDYTSWSPKAVFEAAYFPIEDGTKISEADVNAFRVTGESTKLGEKTTVVLDSTLTGFDMIGTSACVDPANYSQELGDKYARQGMTGTLWGHLGFVLQWAKNGLKAKDNS